MGQAVCSLFRDLEFRARHVRQSRTTSLRSYLRQFDLIATILSVTQHGPALVVGMIHVRQTQTWMAREGMQQ